MHLLITRQLLCLQTQIIIVLLSFILLSLSQPSMAETPEVDPNAQNQAIELIIQEQNRQQEFLDREKIQQQDRKLWDSFKNNSALEIETPPTKANTSEQSNCIVLKKVKFIGSKDFPLLMRLSLRLHSRKFIGSCANIDTLKVLIQSVNKLLFDKGYVTSRAYLIEQDFNDGVFDVSVTAGKISNYQINGLTTWQAALTLPYGVLNHHYLNNGIDNIKRGGVNKPSIKILPSEKFGSSQIKLNNSRDEYWSRFWSGSVNLRNDHANSINRPSSQVTLNVADLLKSNEIFTLSANDSLKDRELQKNRSLSSSLFLPIRRSTWTFNLSKNEFFNLIDGNNITFRTEGNTYNRSLSVNYLLYKSNSNTLLSDWTVAKRRDNNTINMTVIDLQSGIIRKQTFAIDHKINISQHLKVGFRSEKHLGSFTGYDVSIDQEDSSDFKRYLHRANVSYRYNAWQLGFDAYLQESRTALLSDQNFSIYTSFVPGLLYIPAEEGKLVSARLAYQFQNHGIFYIPEIQLTRVEVNTSGIKTPLSGIRLKGTMQYKALSAILEIGRSIITPVEDIKLAGNFSLNYRF